MMVLTNRRKGRTGILDLIHINADTVLKCFTNLTSQLNVCE